MFIAVSSWIDDNLDTYLIPSLAIIKNTLYTLNLSDACDERVYLESTKCSYVFTY